MHKPSGVVYVGARKATPPVMAARWWAVIAAAARAAKCSCAAKARMAGAAPATAPKAPYTGDSASASRRRTSRLLLR